MVDVPEPGGHITDVATLLDLEQLDRDIFRGQNARHGDPDGPLYGGQVAAQALRAAGLTTGDDRMPHSLHGYYLRAGRRDQPVVYLVDRDRDGRSFSARHVRAVQNGEVIFSMLASFTTEQTSDEYEVPATRPAGEPEDHPLGGWDDLVETREVTLSDAWPDPLSDLLWVRVPPPFADDPALQACALAYLSDYGSGFAMLRRPGLPVSGPSIDHVVWFHQPIRVDEWVLIDLRPVRASGARGSYLGTLRNRSGDLGAVVGQEMLLRGARG